MLSNARTNVPMLLKRFDRGWRHGVDRIWANELFHVEHVSIAWILGAGAGPQGPLHICPAIGKRFPSITGKSSQKALIGEFRVRDRGCPQKCLKLGFIGIRRFSLESSANCSVSLGVDPADKEARHTRRWIHVKSGCANVAEPRFQAAYIRLHHVLVHLNREE